MSSFLIQNRFAGMIMFLICIGKILAVAINKKKRCFKNYWMVNRVILNIAGLVCDFVFILNICYERVVYHKILRTNQMLFCLIFVKFVKTLLSWKKMYLWLMWRLWKWAALLTKMPYNYMLLWLEQTIYTHA